MGRLIDADLLSNKINHIGYVPVCADCMTKHNILEIIDAQPTAYDVDKVVEQLKTEAAESYAVDEYSYGNGILLAIDIVKGAVKDE